MKICLINPPNCGRSIPEEEYGITSLKMIFRGEPLALESLAGALPEHDVDIIDLKVNSSGLDELLEKEQAIPDVIAFTGVTCEANTVKRMARKVKTIKGNRKPVVVVGGHHASSDPEFFNTDSIDYVVRGLARASFRELISNLESDTTADIGGIAKTKLGEKLNFIPKKYSKADLLEEYPPAYNLIEKHRDQYVMSGVGGKVGFVVTAFGCTHCCLFCSIPSLTGGKYLTHSIESIVRDIEYLADIPLIRFVDANTFGDPVIAEKLAQRILDRGVNKRFVADVRADTVVKYPELMQLWKKAGLSAVVIGFEEIDNRRLEAMNKKSSLSLNSEALEILSDIGINVIGDFIIAPDYDYEDFERLEKFIADSTISLPIPSILTPIPGTGLYSKLKNEIVISNLDYYTFSNAVLKTKLPQKEFYTLYSDLMRHLHKHISDS